jgi:hypothetical protein
MQLTSVLFLLAPLAALIPSSEAKFSATKIVCLVNKEREKAGLEVLGISKHTMFSPPHLD